MRPTDESVFPRIGPSHQGTVRARVRGRTKDESFIVIENEKHIRARGQVNGSAMSSENSDETSSEEEKLV